MTIEELRQTVMAERRAAAKRTEAIRANWTQDARDAWDDMSDDAVALTVAQSATDAALADFLRDAPVNETEYEEVCAERDMFADRCVKLYGALASVDEAAAKMIVEST